jgi:hypothetical protein
MRRFVSGEHMPLPAGLSTVTITGKAVRPGTGKPDPLTGRITLTPDVPQVKDTASGAYFSGPVIAVPAADGTYSVTVLAPDSAGISPTGWTYSIEIAFTDTVPFVFHAALTKNNPTVTMAELIEAA